VFDADRVDSIGKDRVSIVVKAVELAIGMVSMTCSQS
jgi:hypothetical protein